MAEEEEMVEEEIIEEDEEGEGEEDFFWRSGDQGIRIMATPVGEFHVQKYKTQ